MKLVLTEQQVVDILKNYGEKLSSFPGIDIEKEAPALSKLAKFIEKNRSATDQFTPSGVIKNKVGNFLNSDKEDIGGNGMIHPLGKKYPIYSGFGPRNAPYDPISGQQGTSDHKGVDFTVKSGTPVYAPLDGVVISSRDTTPNRCGGFIELDHANCQTKFCHLRKFAVNEGQQVKRGQLIGYTGGGSKDPMRGTATGPHLHYEILNKSGIALNPTSVQRNLA